MRAQGESERRRTEALAGTAAVCLMVGATKWGAYLGKAPLFLTDVLLLLATVHALASRARLGVRDPGDAPSSGRGSALIGCLVIWAVIRFVSSDGVTLDAIRDFAPYLYAALAFLSGMAYHRSREENRARTLTLLWRALLFHAGWVAAALFVPGVSDFGPQLGEGTGFFHIRTDVDGAILGVTAAWAMLRWLRSEGGRYLLVALGGWGLVFALTSRAGLIGTALAGLLALLAGMGGQATKSRRQLLVAVTPLLLIGALAVLPTTTSGARLLSTFGATSYATQQADLPTAQGTTEARQRAWQHVIDYTTDDPTREAVGVGFGPDFMHLSGADVALISSADTGVRSPHSYYVGTFARLGVVGAGLVVLIALRVLLKAFRLRRDYGGNDLLLVAGLLGVALIPPAAFGVVLESPFGAVPFYWAAGIVLAATATRRAPRKATPGRVTRPAPRQPEQAIST